MRITKIEIIGYRGIKNFFSNFDINKAFVKYGVNGSGKTSLYQALYFALTGQLSPIINSENTSAVHYRHKALPDHENAYVKITLLDSANIEYWIERTIDVTGCVNSRYSTNYVSGIIDIEEIGFSFLNKSIFSSMIDTAERDAWSKLSPLLGFPKIGKFREGIKAVSNNIKQDLGLKQLEESYNRCELAEGKLRDEVEEYSKSLGFTELKKEIFYSVIKSITGVTIEPETKLKEIGWDQIEDKIPGAKELNEINRFLREISLRKQLLQTTPFDQNNLGQAFSFIINIYNTPTLSKEITLTKFYKLSKPLIADFTFEKCLLCDLSPSDWEKIRINLEEKYNYSEEILKEFTVCNKLLTDIRTEYKGILTSVLSWTDFENSVLSNELRSFIEILDIIVERLHKEKPTGSSQEDVDIILKKCLSVEQLIVDTVTLFDTKEKELLSRQVQLSDLEDAKKINILKMLVSAIQKLKSNIEEKKSLKSQLNRTNYIIEKIKALSTKIDIAEDNLNTKLLSGIEGELKTIFSTITNQNELVPKIKVSADRRIRKAEILVQDFYGLGEVPAKNYLSEAYRNSLGLSIFFASLITKNPTFKTFILDDITHSTDAEHRKMLCRYIVHYLKGHFQLFIFTHDDQWHDRLKDELQYDFTGIKIESWNIDGAITGIEKWIAKLANAKMKITSKDKTGGNLLRIAIEEFMDNLCEDLRIKINFKKDSSKIKFEEKKNAITNALTDVWKKNNGVINPTTPAYTRLTNSQKIANLISHSATFEKVNQPDLEDALSDVEEFIEIFKCKNILSNSQQCGAILKDIHKISNLNPECSTCKMPFLA